MNPDDQRDSEAPKPRHSGVDYPQPGAVQEAPYSPPRTKYIIAGLVAIAVLFIVVIASGL
jgi:hypothetical protein